VDIVTTARIHCDDRNANGAQLIMKQNREERTVDRSYGFIRGSLKKDHMWNASNLKLSRVTIHTLGKEASLLSGSALVLSTLTNKSTISVGSEPAPFLYDISWETF
jgi:hypothetical protein